MKKGIIAVLFAVAFPAISSAADIMNPGQWELTTTMEMPGMPIKMPPTKIKHCYTKDDVNDQKKTINTDKNCTVTDLKKSGNKVTWKMTCTGENAGEASGETVYKKDTFDSTMKMKSQGRTMNMKVKAKRIGNCP